MITPVFWKSDLTYIKEMYNSAINCSEKRILCYSAGNRPVYMLAYGEKKELGCANYSSALGAHDKTCFAKAGQKPCVILLGAVHGAEMEGVAALTNLVSLLETGADLAGKKNDRLLELARGIRLVIVPVANVDGRARVKPDSMVGRTHEELRYWNQGTWKDGRLCGWPDCKKIHPIKDAVDFLGGYFNDDGINLMHDNFFHPMAQETQALLDLCADEAADYVIHLHGGSNTDSGMLPTDYVTAECAQAMDALYLRCQEKGDAEGLIFCRGKIPGVPSGNNPPSFNLVSATHHVCGAVAACFESHQGLVEENPVTVLSHAQILRMHEILFEECFAIAQAK